MKRYFKTFVLSLCAVLSAVIFSACTDKVEKVAVTSITLSKDEITLYVSENNTSSDEFVVSYKPANANQTDIEFFSYNTDLIDINLKQGTGDTYVVTAKALEVDSAETYIGVRMKGNPDVQKNCHVVVKKVQTKLNAITNLRYNLEKNRIEWDPTTNTVEDGFVGYKLLINGVEYISPQKAFYADFEKGVKLTVQVKALSGISDLDSDYTDALNFMVLDSIQNFNHNNGELSWDSVKGAEEYSLQINSNTPETMTQTTKQVSFDSAGEYTFKLIALGGTKTDDDGEYICYDSAPAYIKVTKLSAPENFNYQKVFTWNAVVMENDAVPTGYEIYEQSGNTQTLIKLTKDISFALPDDLISGEHSFKVRAIGDGINTISSEFSAIKSINKLEAPTNLRVENGVITWDSNPNAEQYKISFVGYYNGSTYYDEAYSISTGSNENSLELGEMFKGSYFFQVACISDAENTADSDFTSKLEVIKLDKPSVSSFTVSGNKLVWNAVEHASKYELAITIGEESKNEIVYSSEYELSDDLSAGEISYQIKVIGDSTKYLSSDFSNVAFAEKLSSPELYLVAGELRWQAVANSSSYTLSINGNEIDMKKQTTYSFASYSSGNYNVKIKALGGNANSADKHLVGSFSSAYSPTLALNKYSAPTLYVENGVLKATSSENNVPTAVASKETNADGSYSYKAYYPGDNVNHISSNYSASLKIWQAPNVSGLEIKNAVAIWDALDAKYEGATFKVTCTYTDTEGNSSDLTLAENKNNSFSFEDETTYGAGTYTLKVSVVGTSGKQGEHLILSSANSATLSFSRLPQPTLSAYGAMDVVSSGTVTTLPGTLKWTSETINNNSAIGYTLLVKDSKGNTVACYDMHSAKEYVLTNSAGEYKISVEAYGNGTDLLDSGYSEEVTFTKLTSAKNVQLDKYGVLSWESDYNGSNSGAENFALNLAGMSGMPLHLRVLFIIEIDGEYYNPYDLSQVMNGSGIGGINYEELGKLNAQRSVNINDLKKFNGIDGDPINLNHGTHTLRIISAPLNYKVDTGISMYPTWGYENDLTADATSYLTFSKLEQPYGLRADRNENDDHYYVSFTENYNTNISGYEILIKQDGMEDDDDSATTITLDGRTNTKYDFTQYLLNNGITSGSYVVKVRAISTTSGIISSNYTEELKLVILADIDLQIADGQLKWNKIENAEKYEFKFVIGNTTISESFNTSITNYKLSLENNSQFVSGTYNITVRVKGNESSNYGKVIYLDALEAKDYGNFTKLATVTGLEVEGGKIIFNHIDSSSSLNGYQYNIYVTKSNSTSTEKIDNISAYLTNSNKIFSYELPEKYSAGDYSIKVQTMGLTSYLDGEVSDIITPSIVKKLSPTSVYISNGILNWNAVEGNGYLVKISGAKFQVNNETTDSASYEVEISAGTTTLDISGELETITGEKIVLGTGEYSVQVKVLGTDLTYLNSNYSSIKTFKKSASPQNVRIEDGILKWNKFAKADAPNGVMIYISSTDGLVKEQVKISDNNTTSFEFAGDKYPSGKTYSFYLVAVGDTNLNASSFTTGFINGDPSETKTALKLLAPQNPKVMQDEVQLDSIGTFTFDSDYANIEYQISIVVTNGESKKEFTITQSEKTYNLSNLSGITITENTQISIKAKALGASDYISSEFTSTITIIIPPTPTLNVVVDESSRFTGKIAWSEVTVGDFTTTYQLTYQFLDSDTATNTLHINSMDDITEEMWETYATETTISTTELYYHISGKGYYRFKICALVKGSDTIKSNQSEYTESYDFCLFSNGNGTKENPYQIDSTTTFNFIAYNLSAHYKLTKNIDFTGVTIVDIGSQEEQFTGSLDGNNFALYNINISKVNENSSIFGYVGKNGAISNVLVYNISITNGSNVGGIVGKNEGTITNVIVGAKLASNQYVYDEVSSISPYSRSINTNYVGGIVGYNLGTIESCKNYAIIAPKNDNAEVVSGGIAGKNEGTISKSFNYNNVGGLGTYSQENGLQNLSINSNMSGGIVGYNDNGSISYCGNYGNILATSRNSNKISQSGYAGGLVGFNASGSRGSITNSFNDNSNRVYESNSIVANTAIYATTSFSSQNIYVGGLVGFNENGPKVQNCWSISNIQFNTNGTSAGTNLGTAFGLNNGKTVAKIQNLYVFTLNASSITNVGDLIPTSANVNNFVQGGSTTIETFMQTAKNVSGIVDDSQN